MEKNNVWIRRKELRNGIYWTCRDNIFSCFIRKVSEGYKVNFSFGDEGRYFEEYITFLRIILEDFGLDNGLDIEFEEGLMYSSQGLYIYVRDGGIVVKVATKILHTKQDVYNYLFMVEREFQVAIQSLLSVYDLGD